MRYRTVARRKDFCPSAPAFRLEFHLSPPSKATPFDLGSSWKPRKRGGLMFLGRLRKGSPCRVLVIPGSGTWLYSTLDKQPRYNGLIRGELGTQSSDSL